MAERPLPEVEVHVVRSLDDALACKRWLGERHGSDVLALDCETGGLDPRRDALRLTQIGDVNEAWVMPHEDWAGLTKEILGDWNGHWVGHNITFDMRFLERNGIGVSRHRLHDTSVLAHLEDPARRLGLKSLSVAHLDKRAALGQELLNEGMSKQKWTWATVPLDFDPYTFYAGFDTVLNARYYEAMRPVQAQYADVYELEMAVALICSDMSTRGIRIDTEYTRSKKAEIDAYAAEVYAWVEEHYGLKPGSNNAVANRLLADGVRLEKRTKGGAWSVDAEVLTELADLHPLAKAVQSHRDALKTSSTYFRGILDSLDGDVLHPDIKPLGARTGRMSVSKPPFQQLPADSPLVRDCVIPSAGNRLVLCDLDQVEFRILGHFANEPFVRNAVLAGEDLHWAAARVMYGPDATPAQRKKTKNGTFAVLYGAGKDKLAAQQGVTVPEAEAFIAHYRATFPGITNFVTTVEQVARQREFMEGTPYVMSPIGRRHPMDKDKLYTGVNYLCQGTAADMFKQALVRMDAAGVSQYLRLPIHDEAMADVPAELAEEVARTIQACMTDHTSLSVPIDAGYKIVDRWGDAYR